LTHRASDYYKIILQELEAIPVLDTHEHLMQESTRLGMKLDFFTLFDHYCNKDMISAGATEDDIRLLRDKDIPLESRWACFKRFLPAIRTTGFAQSVMITLRDIFGFDDITDASYQAISDAIQLNNKPGRYDEILKNRCNILACVQSGRLGDDGPEYFYHLAPSTEVVDAVTPEAVESLSVKYNKDFSCLQDLLDFMSMMLKKWASQDRVLGIKSAHAYVRSLEFLKISCTEAEVIFSRLMRSRGQPISPEERYALQGFLMRELAARAPEYGLPMVFHTGLQTGNNHRITYANPLLLQTLFEDFPETRFDILHGGMPWVRECAVLAKVFPNVFLNMAWMHMISPAQASSALAEWLDMVPNTKIFGFGGDYEIVENVYGHLTLARRNIARVLAEKAADGSYSLAEAGRVGRKLLLENPLDFYFRDKPEKEKLLKQSGQN